MRDFRALFLSAVSDYQGDSPVILVPGGADRAHDRSQLGHMSLPDGGASVIAGLDTSVEGGDNLIAIFGQWVLKQLLLSIVARVVIWRYRYLVPFALLLQLLDWGGGIGIGLLNPVVAVALWFALLPREEVGSRGLRDGIAQRVACPTKGCSTE